MEQHRRQNKQDTALVQWHGQCHGFEHERSCWDMPSLAVASSADARPGYDSMDASEYLDSAETLRLKCKKLAEMYLKSQCPIVYTGAGLSTGAGIGDYASQADGSLSNAVPPRPAMLAEIQNRAGVPGTQSKPSDTAFRSPLCAQPTLAHRVLVAMHKKKALRWFNQNHDGLPQKAGLPQEAINEIHGAWHAPDNSVVPMSGSLRDDLFSDLLKYEQRTDLAIAVGTSLCGMNADRVVTSVAERAASRQPDQLGSVVIGLQRTKHDDSCTLRIFGKCDDVFAAVAQELQLDEGDYLASPATFWCPPVLLGRDQETYEFHGLSYNAFGERSFTKTSLDLRDDAELVIPTGMHAGAIGTVNGMDREGNIKCIFKLKPKVGKLRAPVPMLIGRWWIQAAVDGTVWQLPAVNKPSEDDDSEPAGRLRAAMEAYAS